MSSRERPLRVLLTGSAGYVGSRVVPRLREAGQAIVVYDNLGTGHRWTTSDADLVVGDVADRPRLEAVLAGGRPVDAVLHLAGCIQVAESLAGPVRYYASNAASARQVFEQYARHGMPRVVLWSTAAVCGTPAEVSISKTTPSPSINPYGASRITAERMPIDTARASGRRHVTLYCFNVAGADPLGRLGGAAADGTTARTWSGLPAAAPSGARPGACGSTAPATLTPAGTSVRGCIRMEGKRQR